MATTPKEDLRKVFLNAGVDPSRPRTCGSGLNACAIAFPVHRLGNVKMAVYDGSCSEWEATNR